jgi:transcriptional regulator with XRE-family HTH domain
MERPLKSYLRTYRRRWGLTQRELAFLIGAESRTTVSRFEQLKRFPNLAATVACLFVFDTTVLDIFPGYFSEIKAAVLERANELYEQLQGEPSAATRAKLDFLEGLLARADGSATKNV